MAVVYLALGSNVGDSKAHISRAVELLSAKIGKIVRAPLYCSRAVGYTDQADFVNTAMRGNTALSPYELLLFTQAIEEEVGRIRRFRWGPREIDIDIIFYDDLIVDKPKLHIPHARFGERDFVLKPLCDIAPSFIDPLSKKTLQVLLDNLPPSELAIQNEIS